MARPLIIALNRILRLCLATLVGQDFIGDGAHAGIGPHILGCLNHVDHSVDRQDYTHDADIGAHTRHEREREEIASHRDTG